MWREFYGFQNWQTHGVTLKDPEEEPLVKSDTKFPPTALETPKRRWCPSIKWAFWKQLLVFHVII